MVHQVVAADDRVHDPVCGERTQVGAHQAGLRTRLMSTGNPFDSAQFSNWGNSCTFCGMRQWLTDAGRQLARATAA